MARRVVVFAAAKCLAREDLSFEFGITFCQSPFEIQRFLGYSQ